MSTFSANLELLPGVSGDPRSMGWLETRPGAWETCRQHPRPPEVVMKEYATWLKRLPHKPVFLVYPAGFGFTFVYGHPIRFASESAFSHSALDIKA